MRTNRVSQRDERGVKKIPPLFLSILLHVVVKEMEAHKEEEEEEKGGNKWKS